MCTERTFRFIQRLVYGKQNLQEKIEQRFRTASLISTGLISTGLISTGLISTDLISTGLISKYRNTVHPRNHNYALPEKYYVKNQMYLFIGHIILIICPINRNNTWRNLAWEFLVSSGLAMTKRPRMSRPPVSICWTCMTIITSK